MGVFVTVFFIIALLCFLLGIYALFCDINNILNKLAFLFCTSVFIWLFDIILSMTSSSLDDAFSWRRLSFIAISLFFGFLLHFIIVLTSGRNPSLLKLFILYLPSILILYMFGLYDQFFLKSFSFLDTPVGWISICENTIIMYLFDIYAIIYLLIGLFLTIIWQKRTGKKEKFRQANLILLAYIITFAIVLSSEVLSKFSLNGILQYTIFFFAAIPLLILIYIITKYKFMKTDFSETEQRYLESYRTIVMNVLAYSLFVGCAVYILTQKINDSNWSILENLLNIFAFAAFGFALLLSKKFITKYNLRVIVFSVLLSMLVPLLTLLYADSASITVWIFPVIIFIAALLFRNSIILIMVSYSTIFTQFYLWVFYPEITVTVNNTDYIGRLIILLLLIILVFYINKIYLLRLKDLHEKIKTQDLLFTLSSDVINLDTENFGNNLHMILNQISSFMNADNVCIIYKPENGPGDFYSWSSVPGALDNYITEIKNILNNDYIKDHLSSQGYLIIDHTADIPESLKNIVFRIPDIKLCLLVPIIISSEHVGIISVVSTKSNSCWNSESARTLITIGNIMGEALNRIRREKKMENMAYFDQLTNIPNRFYFGKIVTQTISHTKIRNEIFCILFLDLDSFKNINDTMGHHFGDKILIAISEKLSECLRVTDTICRFGGDEFLIMLRDVYSIGDIEIVVGKIIDHLDSPLIINEKDYNITASIGISVYPKDGTDKDSLIKNADIAMYKAKSYGKNQYVFCTDEMKHETSQNVIMTNELQSALANNKLQLVYQPQIDVLTGKIIAAEALLRWHSKFLGNVSPAIFIPIAEQTDCIIKIGDWVISEACSQISHFVNEIDSSFRLAINISVKQLMSSHFIDMVKKTLDESKIYPANLEFEITENIAMQDSEQIKNTLEALKNLGISIAIDDFGMEYSSLGRVKSLPIDRIKLDMSFINGIMTSRKDRVILEAIIKMAKDLDLKVIAEGVEEEHQYTYLKEQKCDEIQGYYFYKPLEIDILENILYTQHKLNKEDL